MIIVFFILLETSVLVNIFHSSVPLNLFTDRLIVKNKLVEGAPYSYVAINKQKHKYIAVPICRKRL